jgi:hypothetical protein
VCSLTLCGASLGDLGAVRLIEGGIKPKAKLALLCGFLCASAYICSAATANFPALVKRLRLSPLHEPRLSTFNSQRQRRSRIT